MRKIIETRSSLSYTTKDTSTIMRNHCMTMNGGVTHDCDRFLGVCKSKGTSCFYDFSHSPSLRRHHSVERFLHLFHIIFAISSYVHTV